METIGVTRHEQESLFDLGFWLECEREADLMLRIITGVDHFTPPAGVAAP